MIIRLGVYMSHKYVKLLLAFGMSTVLLTGCQTMDKAQQAATMSDYDSGTATEGTGTDDSADTEDDSDADIVTDVTSDVSAGADSADTEDTGSTEGDYYGADAEVTVDENGVKHAGGFVLYEDGKTSSSESITDDDIEYGDDEDASSEDSDQDSTKEASYTQGDVQEITLDSADSTSN